MSARLLGETYRDGVVLEQFGDSSVFVAAAVFSTADDRIRMMIVEPQSRADARTGFDTDNWTDDKEHAFHGAMVRYVRGVMLLDWHDITVWLSVYGGQDERGRRTKVQYQINASGTHEHLCTDCSAAVEEINTDDCDNNCEPADPYGLSDGAHYDGYCANCWALDLEDEGYAAECTEGN
jgi:hypothetical protein